MRSDPTPVIIAESGGHAHPPDVGKIGLIALHRAGVGPASPLASCPPRGVAQPGVSRLGIRQLGLLDCPRCARASWPSC